MVSPQIKIINIVAMKFHRGIYLLGLAAIICSPAFADSPKKTTKQRDASNEPLRLKLMTYNIRIGAGGGTANVKPTNLSLTPIAKVISPHDLDLVGLEEVDCFRKRSGGMNQPKWFSDRLSMKAAFAPAVSIPTREGLNEDYGVALLSPHWIHSFERFPLFKPDYRKSHPNYPDHYSEPRVLLHALVSIRSRSVHVFVTHLGLTADQREKQVRQIVEIMARFEGPKILLGDFNAEPTSPEMAPLFREYRDTLSEAGVKNNERKSFPAGENSKSAVDYIFVSSDFHVRNAKVVRDSSLASNHNPVIAEVELPW